jgi:DNA primase
MSWQAADLLKQRISLLDYLQGQGWKPARRSAGGRLMGLCPLHPDHRPSFLVDPSKNLFYCYGCGRGGDVIRLAELYHGVRFVDAMALLRHWSGLGSLLPDVTQFYQMHLHRHAEAVAYLLKRGLHQADVIEELRIGYAPGRCLRAWLTSVGYPLESLQQAGLVNIEGHDTYSHRIVFPLEGNLYGRSTGAAAPHRFLPGSKGGLYAWEKVRKCPEIILVEGMFDLAVLWQAGFHNVTCALGTHLNVLQFHQLCADHGCGGGRRTVYLAFDSDANSSGQKAAQCWSQRLRAEGITARRVELPDGHDPNSFFVDGGNAKEFQCLLERACL